MNLLRKIGESFFSLYCLDYVRNITLKICTGKNIFQGNYRATEPKLGDVPFQAGLMLQVNGSYVTFCGGSLIHPRWVLTAAHCLEQDNRPFPANLVSVALGSIYTNGRGAQKIPAVKLAINKKYLETSMGYDVGLIQLKSAAKLGRDVRLVPLHTNDGESLLGKTVYLTGFGIIDDHYQQPMRLRKATLHVSSPDKCLMDPRAGTAEICCTSTISEGKACKGDSGGPLTILKSGKHLQVGITSHLAILPFCKISFNNSVYTRVSAYIAWISKVTGIDFMKYTPS